ncbi:hypothetical protein FOVSG1_003518 [Fusarium oxysporum f. sp. vasinfectum]
MSVIPQLQTPQNMCLNCELVIPCNTLWTKQQGWTRSKSRRPCPETSEASRLNYLECTTRGVIGIVSLVSSH